MTDWYSHRLIRYIGDVLSASDDLKRWFHSDAFLQLEFQSTGDKYNVLQKVSQWFTWTFQQDELFREILLRPFSFSDQISQLKLHLSDKIVIKLDFFVYIIYALSVVSTWMKPVSLTSLNSVKLSGDSLLILHTHSAGHVNCSSWECDKYLNCSDGSTSGPSDYRSLLHRGSCQTAENLFVRCYPRAS